MLQRALEERREEHVLEEDEKKQRGAEGQGDGHPRPVSGDEANRKHEVERAGNVDPDAESHADKPERANAHAPEPKHDDDSD